MSTHFKTINDILHSSGYKVPRPASELDALLDDSDITDEALIDIFVEAYKETHFNWVSTQKPAYKAIGEKVVTRFADRRCVEAMLENDGVGALEQYGAKMIAVSSSPVFLHRIIQKDLSRHSEQRRDVQRQAFDRMTVLDPTYIARALTEGSDAAKAIAAARIEDPTLIQRALTSPKTPLAVRVVLADRFINDGVLGPVVVRSLLSTASVLDSRIAEAKSQARPARSIIGRPSQLEMDQTDLHSVGAAIAQAAEAVYSDVLAQQMISATAVLSDELPAAHRQAINEVALFRGLSPIAAAPIASHPRVSPAFSLANEIPSMAAAPRSVSLV